MKYLSFFAAFAIAACSPSLLPSERPNKWCGDFSPKGHEANVGLDVVSSLDMRITYQKTCKTITIGEQDWVDTLIDGRKASMSLGEPSVVIFEKISFSKEGDTLPSVAILVWEKQFNPEAPTAADWETPMRDQHDLRVSQYGVLKCYKVAREGDGIITITLQ